MSETPFTVRGHGVHTAFREMVDALTDHPHAKVTVNRFGRTDITHIHTVGPYSLLHLLFGRGKKVVSVHVIPDSFVGSFAGARYWYRLAEWYLRWFYQKADLLVAVSEEVAHILKQQLSIKKPVTVIFNTVDRRKYQATEADRQWSRRVLGLSDDQFVVVGVGQVQPRKRFDTFMKLSEALPEMRFFWVGGIPFKRLGADREAMEKLIKSAPPNLTVTGVIELDEVKKYYQAGDAFLLPSEQENHPLAVIEAAASGLPVIVRDIPEYDSSFGNDVLRGDENSFKDILLKLQRDKKFLLSAKQMSAVVAQRFDSSQGAEELLREYHQLLGL